MGAGSARRYGGGSVQDGDARPLWSDVAAATGGLVCGAACLTEKRPDHEKREATVSADWTAVFARNSVARFNRVKLLGTCWVLFSEEKLYFRGSSVSGAESGGGMNGKGGRRAATAATATAARMREHMSRVANWEMIVPGGKGS